MGMGFPWGGGRGPRGRPGPPGTGGGLTPASPIQTTDATPQVIFSEELTDPGTCIYQAFVVTRKSDGSETAWFIRTASVRRDGGAAILDFDQADFTRRSDPNIKAEFAVSGNNVQVLVTGLAGSTFNWKAATQKLCLP